MKRPFSVTTAVAGLPLSAYSGYQTYRAIEDYDSSRLLVFGATTLIIGCVATTALVNIIRPRDHYDSSSDPQSIVE